MNGLAIAIGIFVTGQVISAGVIPGNTILAESGVDLVAENGTDVLITE